MAGNRADMGLEEPEDESTEGTRGTEGGTKSAEQVILELLDEMIDSLSPGNCPIEPEVEVSTSKEEENEKMVLNAIDKNNAEAAEENTEENFEIIGVGDFIDDLGNYLPAHPSSGSFVDELNVEDNIQKDDDGSSEFCREASTKYEAGYAEAAEDALVLMHVLMQENKDLRLQMSKMKRVMAFVMSKYRNSVAFLLNELQVYKDDFQKLTEVMGNKGRGFDTEMKVYNLIQRVEEMKGVMWHAARVDDQTANLYEEKIAALCYQNQGLQKLVRIALDYNGEHLLRYENKETQTDSETWQTQASKETCSEDNVGGTREMMDLLLGSLEVLDQDLDESFHTAVDSFNGSNTSLNKLLVADDEEANVETIVEEVVTCAERVATIAGAARVGDQDKLEIDEESLNTVLLDSSSSNELKKQ